MEMNGKQRPGGKQCIDASTDKAMLDAGNNLKSGMGVNCTKNESKKDGEKFIIETDCMMNNTRMVSNIVFEGDFNSAYISTMNTKYDPSFMGQTSMKVVTTAKYEGPCQDGQLPGDMILPNGMKMNLNDLGKK